jgi:APA family basic amino acid/polyamine antiporter
MATLQRRLNRTDALAIALGGVIGVGVFRNTGHVLSGTGGLVGATAMWIVVGVVCLAGAVLYADLSARVPEAGGPYAYVRVAFGRPVGFVYGWLNAGLSMPVRQASVVAFAGELLSAWLPGGARVLAISVLILLAGLNLLGVKAGAITQRVFTTGKLATLLLVVILAILLMRQGVPASTASVVPVSFAVALAACWYTYLGWQDVVLLAEELHQPRRDLPVVLIGTVAFTMVAYLVVHLAVYFGLGGGPEAYGALPARAIAGYVLGALGGSLLTVLTLASTLGGAAESMLVRPRVAMALARDGLAPAPIAAVNQAGTPHGALLFHTVLTLALVASGTYDELLPLLGFSQGFLGIFETASYFVVRRKKPELPTSRFHPWAPLLFIAVNIALCVFTGLDSPRSIGFSLAVLVGLVVVYTLGSKLFPRRPRVTHPDPVATTPKPDSKP